MSNYTTEQLILIKKNLYEIQNDTTLTDSQKLDWLFEYTIDLIKELLAE